MKKYIILIILLGLCVKESNSQEKDFTTLSISPELKENANAIVRDQSTEITIEDVDKMMVTEKKVVTVLNQEGQADARIVQSYDDDIKIMHLTATIYNAYGKQIKKFKEKDFFDVSAVDGVSLYTDNRVKYIDYKPISYPYTLVFETEYKTGTTGFIPWWFPVNGYYISVENSSYTINNPKQIPWRTKERNFSNFNIEKTISDTAIQLKLKNQRAYQYEKLSTSSTSFLPTLKVALNKFSLKGVYGEATNWQEFGKWRYDYLKNGNDKLSEEIENRVLGLVKDVEDPIEKAKIIYQYMQNRTRYISVQEGVGGWNPIPANEVDKVGYGDCKGLTNYTKAMLDVVGVKSHYCVVWAGSDRRNIEKDFFGMQGNHIILNIPNNGNDIWLECTSQTMPFGFLGDFTHDRNVLVVTPEGGIIKRTPAYKNDANLQTLNAIVNLNDKGTISAKVKRISKGIEYDNKSHYNRYTHEDLIKNYKSRVWDYNNNLEINSCKLENDKENITLTEDLDITIENFATVNPNEILYRVNVFNKKAYIPKRYRNRKMPLKIGSGYKNVDNYTFKIPESHKIEYLPEPKEIISTFGTYQTSFQKIDESTFTMQKSISIKEGVYPKEEYKNYRNFRRRIAKLESLRIALIKK